MSFKTQSVFSATYTNSVFTITESMNFENVSVKLISGTGTILGSLGVPNLTNSTISLTIGQSVVLSANTGYSLDAITIDSTSGGVFEIYGIYGYTESLIDPSAQAFIIATGINDPIQIEAVNNLVIGLKANSLWTKMKAIYPFVGGTATTHKYNLKNPVDSDAAFRLVFNGGWTHSSTGATPNGVNAYANTFLIPEVELDYGSAGYYSRTSTPEIGGTDQNGIVIGVRSDNGPTVNNAFNLRIKSNPSNNNDFFYSRTGITTNTSSRAINSSGLGFYVGTLNTSTGVKLYRNAVDMLPTYFNLARSTPNRPVYIGAINDKGTAFEFSLKESAFAHIGDQLTNTDVVNLTNLVETFEVTLSRNV